MTRLGLLMIGCASIFTISGCIADSPAEGADESRATDAERVASPDIATAGITPGQFGPLRLTNTQLCLQPVGGSTGDVLVELHGCNGLSEQQWQFFPVSPSFMIINQQSQKCLYNNAPLPLFDKGKPITH